MTSTDQYRIQAVECATLGDFEPHQRVTQRLEILAQKPTQKALQLADLSSGLILRGAPSHDPRRTIRCICY